MVFEADGHTSEARWFAVWTKSRQEKVAASMLESLGVPTFLPLQAQMRQWSDRRQRVMVPLFSGYLFVRMDPNTDSRLQVLKTPGIAGFVGNQKGPLAIPDQQIDNIRLVLEQQTECTVLPFLEEGDRVRVVRGVLSGIEGRLLRVNSTSRFVISIELIQKSLAISVSRQDVELIEEGQGRLLDMARCEVA